MASIFVMKSNDWFNRRLGTTFMPHLNRMKTNSASIVSRVLGPFPSARRGSLRLAWHGLTAISASVVVHADEPFRLDRLAVVRFSALGNGEVTQEAGLLHFDGRTQWRSARMLPIPPGHERPLLFSKRVPGSRRSCRLWLGRSERCVRLRSAPRTRQRQTRPDKSRLWSLHL